METIRRNWPLLLALSAVSVAWGETRYQVHNLDKRMQQQVEIQRKQAEIRETQARVDERTKHILEGQKRMERTLERLMQQRGQ